MSALRVIGFATIYLPPCLLVLGRASGQDWLLPAFFFAGLPVLTILFGSVRGRGSDVGPLAQLALLWMPRLYVVLFVATLYWTLSVLSAGAPSSTISRVFFPIALLVMCGLASCVAHDLLHRSGKGDRLGAHLVAALAGYPFFVYEHLRHHAAPRDTASANCPRHSECVWTYAWRRFWVVPAQSFELSRTLHRAGRGSIVDWLPLWILVSSGTAVAFSVVGGAYGLMCYGMLVVGVPFLLNTVTYIQHWGLGDDNPHIPAGTRQIGWDDATRLQSWLILGISFHDEHHANPGQAYYTYAPSGSAPRLPSEYALMVLACFVPSLWRRLMVPQLDRWTSGNRPPLSAAA